MQYAPHVQQEIDRTNAECRRWAAMVNADELYSVCAMWVGETPDEPFGYEWQIWDADGTRDWWLGPIATIYNHGTGPEWAGDYGPYYRVVKPQLDKEEAEEFFKNNPGS